MSKLTEDDATKMASEPVVQECVAANPQHRAFLHYEVPNNRELSFDTEDAPCQYTVEEVKKRYYSKAF